MEETIINIGDRLIHHTPYHNNEFVVETITSSGIKLRWVKHNGGKWDDILLLSKNLIFNRFNMKLVSNEVREIEDD